MSEYWKDCDQPWTIDEFLEAREHSVLDEAHPAVWATTPPTADGHYWIYRKAMASVDVIEVVMGEAFIGLDCLEGRWPDEKLLYGPRIPTIKAPR